MEFKKFKRNFHNGNGEVNWSPYWEIVLKYERPDGKPEGEFGRPYFVDRHINPDPFFDWNPKIDRNSKGRDEDAAGCHVSIAALPPVDVKEDSQDYFAASWKKDELKGGELFRDGDGRTAHQRDWDFLEQSIEEQFNRYGINKYSSTFDRVSCLAELCNEHRGRVFPSRHPADVLLHSSFCVGAGNTMTALCHVAGIPARTVHTSSHTMAEVFIDGKWTFVDNFSKDTANEWLEVQPGRKAHAVFRNKNFTEVLMNPFSGIIPEIPDLQAQRYVVYQWTLEPYINTGSLNWLFNQTGMGNVRTDPFNSGAAMCVRPCPENVKAIYPEWETPIIESIPGRDNELILNPRQGWCKTVVQLDRGMGIKKEFYIGEIDSSNSLLSARCDLHLVDGITPGFDPVRGGWEFFVNGKSIPLNNGNYRFTSGLLSINIPVASFKEKAINEIRLISSKKYNAKANYRMPDALPLWAYPDPLKIEKAWYAPERDNYEVSSAVINTHSAWLLRPDAV